MLTPLNTNLETAALLVLLVIGFVVAFKLLEMIFETIMVSVLSAGFYAAMSLFMNFPLSLNNMLLFAFLGSTLYMVFSVAASTYTVVSKIIGVPLGVLKSVYGLLGSLKTPEHKKDHRRLRKRVQEYSKKVEEVSKQLEEKYNPSNQSPEYQKKEEDSEDRESEKEVKEVVLDKVKEDKTSEELEEDDEDEYRINPD